MLVRLAETTPRARSLPALTCASTEGSCVTIICTWPPSRSRTAAPPDFAAALSTAGKPVQLLVGEGYNHFEMPETLANPYGLLGRAVLKEMRLGREAIRRTRDRYPIGRQTCRTLRLVDGGRPKSADRASQASGLSEGAQP